MTEFDEFQAAFWKLFRRIAYWLLYFFIIGVIDIRQYVMEREAAEQRDTPAEQVDARAEHLERFGWPAG